MPINYDNTLIIRCILFGDVKMCGKTRVLELLKYSQTQIPRDGIQALHSGLIDTSSLTPRAHAVDQHFSQTCFSSISMFTPSQLWAWVDAALSARKAALGPSLSSGPV